MQTINQPTPTAKEVALQQLAELFEVGTIMTFDKMKQVATILLPFFNYKEGLVLPKEKHNFNHHLHFGKVHDVFILWNTISDIQQSSIEEIDDYDAKGALRSAEMFIDFYN